MTYKLLFLIITFAIILNFNVWSKFYLIETVDEFNQNLKNSNRRSARIETEMCQNEMSYSDGLQGDPCRTHLDCSYQYENYLCQWKNGTEDGKCRKKSCASNEDCKLFTNFPSKCHKGACVIKYCYSNKECPEGYGCHNTMCKKIYGNRCEFDCDCGKCYFICFKAHCYCKDGFNCQPDKPTEAPNDPGIMKAPAPAPTTISAPAPAPTTTPVPTTTPEQELYAAGIMEVDAQYKEHGRKKDDNDNPGSDDPTETCPTEVSNGGGKEGDSCRTHLDCSYEYEKYLCQWKNGTEEGKCQKKSCSSNEDCKSFTDFPSKCHKGFCVIKYCYDKKECPAGYGCHGVTCKKVHGSTCEFDCDCGKCYLMCFKNQCYCKEGFICHDTKLIQAQT